MDTPQHKAIVDSQGNIILPAATPKPHIVAEDELNTNVPSFHMTEGVWHSLPWEETEQDIPTEPAHEEEPAAPATPAIALPDVWSTVRTQLYRVTSDAMEEGARQYKTSITDTEIAGKRAVRSAAASLRSLWTFVRQPVWVPGRKKTPVQHSRGTLFVLDTVRFGGTFATLFLVLFGALNYQSFWSIGQAYIHPLAEVTGIDTDGANDKGIAQKLKRIPNLAVAGQAEGGLIDYLPPVGPPDNRLIIPKLDLNVPIVVPPNDALIREDWKQLETDIQHGLQDGVVHYPGTARPGQAGNFFVTGHSSYFPWAPGDYKSVFARLHNLDVGDEYWVFYKGDRYRYIIQSKKEIKPSDVSVLDQPVGKRVSTLMTCTPVGTTLRRLIITAQEVDPVSGLALEVGEHRHTEQPTVKMDMLPI